jgi:hypothetical protein
VLTKFVGLLGLNGQQTTHLQTMIHNFVGLSTMSTQQKAKPEQPKSQNLPRDSQHNTDCNAQAVATHRTTSGVVHIEDDTEVWKEYKTYKTLEEVDAELEAIKKRLERSDQEGSAVQTSTFHLPVRLWYLKQTQQSCRRAQLWVAPWGEPLSKQAQRFGLLVSRHEDPRNIKHLFV